MGLTLVARAWEIKDVPKAMGTTVQTKARASLKGVPGAGSEGRNPLETPDKNFTGGAQEQ